MKAEESGRLKINFNSDWKFLLGDAEGAGCTTFEHSSWESVSLPHTPRLEDIDVYRHFQGVCWYRKHFMVDRSYKGKKVFIEFEAAMHTADIWVNGKHLLTHQGGYLPFTIDISGEVLFDKENIIAVRLDNRDNGDIPPGKPLDKLDFCYFGGLYRNVHMHVTNRLHVTDAVYANSVAGGGVFITYPAVSKELAQIEIRTHVINEYEADKYVKVAAAIVDGEGVAVQASESEPVCIPAGGEYTFLQKLTVENPKLWHPDSPELYTAGVRVIDAINEDIAADEVRIRVGIRSIACRKPEGFILNGEPVNIRGANRHQQYPYIGIAASDNAQYRDARKLKEAGFNFIRLAHYPQSPAFLDACDELGLMLVEPVPGWQWCREGVFQNMAIQNIREMIRRDRNHPSAVMWEVSLNETGTYWPGADDEFFHRCHEAAHQEYPGDQLLTSGDTLGRKNPVLAGFDIPHTEWDEEGKSRPLTSLPYKMGLDREYGDFEFGGHNSTTRVFRRDGERALLQQAWNYQWSHNKNLGRACSIGDAIWVGIDYNRGYASDKPICSCGILDTFRLPKFAYYFFKSQAGLESLYGDTDGGPMVYIANYWMPSAAAKKIVVYSNCDTVRLYINGKAAGERTPDDGPDVDFNAQEMESTVDYWLQNGEVPRSENEEDVDPLAKLTYRTLYDGGNSRRLAHAPFTFTDIAYEDGELKAVGIVNGAEAASHGRRTPGNPSRLSVRCDTSGRELNADGSDFVFLYAEITDKNGTVIPDAEHEVKFRVVGPGSLVGANPVKAEAGIGSILLRSQPNAGRIVVTAENAELGAAEMEITSKKECR